MHVLDTCCPLMAVGPCKPWDSTGFVHSMKEICLAQSFFQCFYRMGQISGEKVWRDIFTTLHGLMCLFPALRANPIICSLLLPHPILL